MATIYANHAFSILDFDLNLLQSTRTDWTLAADANVAYRGHRYPDLYLLEWADSGNDFASLFRGDGLEATAGGRLTGGVVQSYSEMLWTGSRYYELWGMTGVSIDAAELAAAMRSQTSADDDALLIETLAGHDLFDLSPDADVANGFAGRDTLLGGGGGDVLAGGAGDDQLFGQAGSDDLFLDPGRDLLVGGSGQDWIYATGTTDISLRLAVAGGQQTGFGADIIRGVENAAGAGGDDRLTGSGIANILRGNRGDDALVGLAGHDTLDGGGGADTLIGGAGRDRLVGASGADRFVFRSLSEMGSSAATADEIADFKPGVDVIDLRGIDASSLVDGNNAFLWLGETAIGSLARGEVSVRHLDRMGTMNDVTVILIDTDDDPAAEAQIRLAGLHDLDAGDFLF